MGAATMRSNRRPTGKRTSNNKEIRTTNLKDQLLLGSRLQLIEHAVPLRCSAAFVVFNAVRLPSQYPARGNYEGQPLPAGAAAATAAAFERPPVTQ